MRAFRPLLLPLALWAAPAAAQQAPAPAAAAGPASEPGSEQVATGDSGLRMTVPVSIAGAGPFPFLIDTGSQRTAISRELAQTLGLLPGRPVRVTAMSGVAPSATVRIPSITVSPGGIAGHSIDAPAFAADNLGAPGLLGIDALQDRRVAIDLDTKTMAVFPAARRRRADEAAGEIVVRARSVFGQLVMTDAWVDGVRVRVILDTGSVASVGNLALRHRLGADRPGRRAPPVERIALVSVLGDSLIADYTALPSVRIGDLAIEALPVAYADAAPFRHLGLLDKPAMLLGMDAIGLFRRVEIDFPNREVRLLLPRSLAAERARRRRAFPPG